MVRVGRKELKFAENRVNYLLKNIRLKVSSRYGYKAIDICDKNGNVIDTLIAGLSGKEAWNILDAIARVIELEKYG